VSRRRFLLTDRARTFLSLFWTGKSPWRPFPSSSPSAPLSVSQLPIPAETPRVSATPSLRGFAGETVPHPLPSTDSRYVGPWRSIFAAPSFANGLRPPAPGGAAKKNRRRGSAPPPAPTSRANKWARLVLPAQTQGLAASAQPPGIIGGGFPPAAPLWSSSLSLAPAHSAPRLEGGGRVLAFLPRNWPPLSELSRALVSQT
jgi:hypothetical protein